MTSHYFSKINNTSSVLNGMFSQQKGLCASIVIYQSDWGKFQKTLLHLFHAIQYAQDYREINQSHVIIVDNSFPSIRHQEIMSIFRECGWQQDDMTHTFEVIHTGRNLGFGSAHNLAIMSHSLPFHLILNPDVYVSREGILQARQYCMEHPEVVLLSPAIYGTDGQRQHLLRPAPTLYDVFLRFLAMSFPSIQEFPRYARYECRHLDPDEEHRQIVSMSGCFMWCRTQPLQSMGGFDPHFFLYYEDYDLSRRMAQIGRTVYYPTIRVIHDWERLIVKSHRLRLHNLLSAIKYFNKWGWKLF